MDDERWVPGMPVLDRQPVREAVAVDAGRPAHLAVDAAPLPAHQAGPRRQPPRSVPEDAPTPLQRHFVLLSAPALVAGAIAITALEAGAGFGSWLVKLCVLVAAPLLLATTADATVRIWRSAWAWMPVERGRGLFRLTWVLASLVFLALVALAAVLVLGA
jgi:hypothetical protein